MHLGNPVHFEKSTEDLPERDFSFRVYFAFHVVLYEELLDSLDSFRLTHLTAFIRRGT